ncbi:MAG TPA: M3 family metallopeptidase, partial [Rhodothermales bacterium]|nr:M3 family metallopeptidase [Rhodothermales bacterium]
GHLVHALLAGQSAIMGEVEWDFIEAPSQLVEEWEHDPAVLRSFARHYETGEPIPEELIAAYRRAEGFGRALFARAFGLWPAALSLELFDGPPAEEPTAAVEARVTEAYFPFEVPDGFHLATSLPHLNPYSSNYYTYLWSAVIARDLLTGFDRDNLLDPAAGRRYRDVVLAQTGRAPAGVLVERFLGRPFNADAWRAWLGGEDEE